MTLRVKFNVVMLAAFLAGLVLAGVFVNRASEREARRSVLSEAAVIMGAASATIHYTDGQVAPLLNGQMKAQFLPQSIPFFAAQQTFGLMAQAFPDYAFRQPTTNPTNPADRPVAWEAKIIKALAEQPKLGQLVTERKTNTGEVMSYSQPIRVTTNGCLACHSTSEAAPASMVDIYGPNNGFGWKLGDLVGAEIVSMPERVPLDRARSNLDVIMGGLTIVFALMFVMLNLLLHFFIIVPLRRISKLADEISLGNMGAPEFGFSSKDEIGSLAVSFNRMRRSLVTAMRMLGE
jgi:HAMP domain-containing protein